MPFLDENGLEQVLTGIRENTLPFSEDLVFDGDNKLTNIVMGNVKSNVDENGWVWTAVDDPAVVNNNGYINDTSNADYIYEYKPAQIEYSVNEVDTGNKWIDGKPIYRIVMENTLTLAADTTFGTMPAYETIVSCYCIAKIGTETKPVPYCFYNNDNWEINWTIQANGTIMMQAGSSHRVSATVHFIIEYTKTTDTI